MGEKKRGPAVVDGRLVYTSVSAMARADEAVGGCLRAWRYRYVERLPDKPPGKGAQRGIDGHARIADYLTTGEDRLDPLERMALGYMPRPRTPGLLVEFPVDGLLDARGVPLVGSIDLADLSNPQRVVLTDWKFKKDVLKYGASAADLLSTETQEGVQLIGYGEALRRYLVKSSALRAGQQLVVRHVQFQYVGRRDVAEVAHEPVPLDGVTVLWQTVAQRVIPKMWQAAEAASPQDVKPNLSACDAYGGCAFRSVCLDPAARLASVLSRGCASTKEKDPMALNLQDKLKSITAGAPTPPPATVPPTPPPPPPAQASPPPAPKVQIVDVPEGYVLAKDAEQGRQYHVSGKWTVFSALTRVNGALMAAFTAPDGGVTVPAETTVVYPAPQPEASPPAPAPVPSAPPAEIQVKPPDAPEPIAKKAKKAKAEAAHAEAAPVPEAPKAEPAKVTASKTEALTGVRLYIGCAPLAGGVPLNGYVDLIQAAVLEAARAAGAKDTSVVHDLRMAGGELLGFGKWRGWVPAAVKLSPPPAGHYVALPGDERVDVVAQALMGLLPPENVVR